MSLDHRYLNETLRKLRDENGRGFYTDLAKDSGVANIGRYARGEKDATFETWLRLHNARPDDIPAPCYQKGQLPAGMVSTGDNNRLVQTSTYVENAPNYSDELLELMKVLDQYANKVEIKALLRKWKAAAREVEKM